jgi:G3E family GTPase
MDENVGRKAKLDAVVTVADAKWLQDRLKDAPEAKNQIAFADVILLNKADLVTPDELREVEARIRGINPVCQGCTGPSAAASRCPRCSAATRSTSTASWRSSPNSSRATGTLTRTITIMTMIMVTTTTTLIITTDGGGLKHYHDEEMQSVSIRTDKPLNPDKFFPWVQDLVQKEGPSILRCKGILAFKDDDERFVFQGVHMILDGDHQRPWKAGEKRESRLVFIGRKLPEDKIRQGFEGCLA